MTGAVVTTGTVVAEVINLMSLTINEHNKSGPSGSPLPKCCKWGLAASGTQSKKAFTRSPNSVEFYCAGGVGNSQAHPFFIFF